MRLLQKLKSRGGFSLVEMLVAVLILSIMSSVACMGIATALQDRAKAIVVANAQTVASTAAQAVGDQVRYGQIIQVDPDAIVLSSSTYGDKVKLCLDADGHLVAQSVNSPSIAYALLGEKAYGGLTLSELKFTPDITGDVVNSVTIDLSVAGDSGSLWSLSYTVSPMNSHMIPGI